MKKPIFIPAALIGLALQTVPVSAQSLVLPAPAVRTFESAVPEGGYAMPIGPFAEGQVQFQSLTGNYSLETWRLSGNSQPSHLLMADLGRQLANAGYEVLYQCAEIQCGGFDFRFGIDVVSEPDMHVDLGDFQYLAAYKPAEDASKNSTDAGAYITLMVSRSPGAGFVQIARVGPNIATDENGGALATVTSTMTDPAIGPALDTAPIADQLEQNGYAVLADLVFQTGSSELGEGPFDSLSQLAAYLVENPESSVALVGHSDASGSLAINITVSKRRAGSVRDRLLNAHGLSAAQLTAEGVGFLSPLGSNATDAGRTQNRRVEVVLTSTR